MRFGIISMQMEALVPSGVPAAQVWQNLTNFDHAALAESLAEKGFNPVELGGDLGMFLPGAYSPEAIEKLTALKAGGLGYTLHLPLWSVEPSTPLAPVRQGSVEAIIRSIQETLPLEPEVYVLHATGSLAAEFYNMNISETARALILRMFQSGARQSIETILEQTGIQPRKLAVETIEFPLDLTLDLAQQFDTSICFDCGHVLAGFPGWFDFFDVLEKVLPYLAEVHLHDSMKMPNGVRGYGRDHKPLGQGDLELERFLDRLHVAHFNGPLVFELSMKEALESLKMIDTVCPQYLQRA